MPIMRPALLLGAVVLALTGCGVPTPTPSASPTPSGPNAQDLKDRLDGALDNARRHGTDVPIGGGTVSTPTADVPVSVDPCALYATDKARPARTNVSHGHSLDAVLRYDDTDPLGPMSVVVVRLGTPSAATDALAWLRNSAGACGDQAVVTNSGSTPTPVTTTAQPLTVAGGTAFAVHSESHAAAMDLDSVAYHQDTVYTASGPYLVVVRGAGGADGAQALVPYLVTALAG